MSKSHRCGEIEIIVRFGHFRFDAHVITSEYGPSRPVGAPDSIETRGFVAVSGV
jgi:hypothetical protein